MASRNYILPTGSMSLSSQADYRMKAIAAGLARATEKRIGDISNNEIPGYSNMGTPGRRYNAVLDYLKQGGWPEAFDVREAQNILDFGTALDQYNTAALAAVGTNYSCFQAIAAPTMAANKLAVFFKVGVETAGFPVSRLTFRSGGAAGNLLAVYDLEQLTCRLEADGYFSEPVVIDPQINFAVQAMARIATGVLARLNLGCYVVEPSGQTVS